MNEQEIRAKYQIRPLDNQIEFDRMMHELNDDQTKQNHPYLDRERELIKQRDMLMTQKKPSTSRCSRSTSSAWTSSRSARISTAYSTTSSTN